MLGPNRGRYPLLTPFTQPLARFQKQIPLLGKGQLRSLVLMILEGLNSLVQPEGVHGFSFA